MATGNENNLIWIDLEMTGLDPERDRIIEIATLVTDANLNILAEGPVMAVHQSDAQLALMDGAMRFRRQMLALLLQRHEPKREDHAEPSEVAAHQPRCSRYENASRQTRKPLTHAAGPELLGPPIQACPTRFGIVA